MKLIAGVCAALAISTVGLISTTHAEATVDEQARAEEITAVGCVRAWKPAAADVTKLPENREPGMAGMFLFTPLTSSSVPGFELPTVQEIALAPTQLPENRPNPQSFPRLTVRTMTRLSDTCPS